MAWKPAVAVLALCAALLAAPGPAAAQTCPEPQTTEPGTPGPGGPPTSPPGGPPTSPPGEPPEPGGPPSDDPGTEVICPPINPPDAFIAANPTVCTIPAGGSTCSSTIQWSSQNLSNVQVKVFSHASGTTQLFASGVSGTQTAPWIDAAGVRFDVVSGTTTWDSVEVKGNLSPTVGLSAPASGAVFLAPATIGLSASASDTDGTIAKVEFFNGATLLGTDTTAPYSFTWSNVAAGSYSLTAKATDNLGAATTSSAVTVTASTATVTFTATNKLVESVVAAPATASASFRLAQAGKIRFQTSVGGTWVEQAPLAEWLEPESTTLAANFEVFATLVSGPLSGGTLNQWLALSAAQDWTLVRASVGPSQAVVNLQIRRIGTTTVLGAADVTLKATVTNVPPTVSLTAPADGAKFTAPADITLTATASDPDGTISKVEFYNGSTLLNTDFSSPYSYDWLDVPGSASDYLIKARAYDNLNAWTDSAVHKVTVNALPDVTLPPPPAQTAPAGGTCTFSLSATASDTDGTISQVEFLKDGVPLPASTGNPNPDTAAPYAFTWSSVAPGTYNLSARATDNRSGQSTSPTVPATCSANILATVNLTSPADGASFPVGDPIPISATASDPDGSIANVRFFRDNEATAFVTDLAAPFSTTWSDAAVGPHTLKAIATDNRGADSLPSTVSITVTAANQAPTASITAPANNASFTAPATITLKASASDPDGSVSKVEYFKNGEATAFATGGAAPDYAFPWPNVPAGTYTLTAKATDNLGLQGPASAPVTITVADPAPCFTLPPRPPGAP